MNSEKLDINGKCLQFCHFSRWRLSSLVTIEVWRSRISSRLGSRSLVLTIYLNCYLNIFSKDINNSIKILLTTKIARQLRNVVFKAYLKRIECLLSMVLKNFYKVALTCCSFIKLWLIYNQCMQSKNEFFFESHFQSFSDFSPSTARMYVLHAGKRFFCLVKCHFYVTKFAFSTFERPLYFARDFLALKMMWFFFVL